MGNILTEHSANDCSALTFYELNWNSAARRTGWFHATFDRDVSIEKYHPPLPPVKYIARIYIRERYREFHREECHREYFASLTRGENLRDSYTYRSRLITFSLRESVKCSARWEIRGIFFLFFFYADSAARPVICSGCYGFSAISGIVLPPRNRSDSNIQMLKKAAVLFFFFASRETAARAIRHVMKTARRNLCDSPRPASSNVQREHISYLSEARVRLLHDASENKVARVESRNVGLFLTAVGISGSFRNFSRRRALCCVFPNEFFVLKVGIGTKFISR